MQVGERARQADASIERQQPVDFVCVALRRQLHEYAVGDFFAMRAQLGLGQQCERIMHRMRPGCAGRRTTETSHRAAHADDGIDERLELRCGRGARGRCGCAGDRGSSIGVCGIGIARSDMMERVELLQTLVSVLYQNVADQPCGKLREAFEIPKASGAFQPCENRHAFIPLGKGVADAADQKATRTGCDESRIDDGERRGTRMQGRTGVAVLFVVVHRHRRVCRARSRKRGHHDEVAADELRDVFGCVRQFAAADCDNGIGAVGKRRGNLPGIAFRGAAIVAFESGQRHNTMVSGHIGVERLP